MNENLNPERALIFRIVHVANLRWILERGELRCGNSSERTPAYVNIGNPELIDKRSRRPVPVPPGGMLSDYVPFYFTPFSMMMFNIITGHGGITRRDNRDIIIFVSSIHRIREMGLQFLFTNQHAYPPDTEFYTSVEDLDKVDWGLLRSRNFKTEEADPGRQLRYQAEALVHQCVPLEALLGIGCYDDNVKLDLELQLKSLGSRITVKTTANWYF
jgi:ssDNA thymidine ADP-ribosyltransferase, DarT